MRAAASAQAEVAALAARFSRELQAVEERHAAQQESACAAAGSREITGKAPGGRDENQCSRAKFLIFLTTQSIMIILEALKLNLEISIIYFTQHQITNKLL